MTDGGDSVVSRSLGQPALPSLRGVLFDMDGVLIDSYEVWFHLLNGARESAGLTPVSRSRFHSSWGQGVAADRESFLADWTDDELARYYIDHFMDHREHLVVDPEGRRVLETVRSAGLGTAVITNTPGVLARRILVEAGMAAGAVVGDGDVREPKPAPEVVHRACGLLGMKAGEAVVVGDSRYDREAAARSGAFFVGLRIDGNRRIERLGDLPVLLGLTGDRG
jgi:phosphoglycolate phosphatase/AHBA synthesis associated protein